MNPPKKLARAPVGAGTTRLSDLLAAHRRHAPPRSLAASVGDGYLVATNPVYRNVRDAAVGLGYRFTREGAAEYHAFPLMSLDRVLRDRAVPYLDNVSWLETLEAGAPGRFSLADAQKFALKPNYVFHESAHGLAEAALSDARGAAPGDTPQALVGELAGESFANAAEAMSWALVTGEIGAYFLSTNTHFVLESPGIAALIRSIAANGATATLKILIYAFLHSNFLYSRLDAPELERLARLSGLPGADASVSDAAAIAFDLSDTFRTETAILYLAKQGYSDQTLAWIDGDPVDLADDGLIRAIDRLAESAAAGVDAEFGLDGPQSSSPSKPMST